MDNLELLSNIALAVANNSTILPVLKNQTHSTIKLANDVKLSPISTNDKISQNFVSHKYSIGKGLSHAKNDSTKIKLIYSKNEPIKLVNSNESTKAIPIFNQDQINIEFDKNIKELLNSNKKILEKIENIQKFNIGMLMQLKTMEEYIKKQNASFSVKNITENNITSNSESKNQNASFSVKNITENNITSNSESKNQNNAINNEIVIETFLNTYVNDNFPNDFQTLVNKSLKNDILNIKTPRELLHKIAFTNINKINHYIFSIHLFSNINVFRFFKKKYGSAKYTFLHNESKFDWYRRGSKGDRIGKSLKTSGIKISVNDLEENIKIILEDIFIKILEIDKKELVDFKTIKNHLEIKFIDKKSDYELRLNNELYQKITNKIATLSNKNKSKTLEFINSI